MPFSAASNRDGCAKFSMYSWYTQSSDFETCGGVEFCPCCRANTALPVFIRGLYIIDKEPDGRAPFHSINNPRRARNDKSTCTSPDEIFPVVLVENSVRLIHL